MLQQAQGLLLWLQFAYSVWQFVRVAKFFRLPSALLYHVWLWMSSGREADVGKPFSRQMLVLIVQGRTWIHQQANYLQDGDRQLNAGHYLQQRRGVAYVVKSSDLANCNVLDRYTMRASDSHMGMFLCSKADLIVPDFYIADVYHWADGMDRFLMEGSGVRRVKARVLLTSSRENFLNQNFMRLLSILPLMLQAKNLNSLSLWASTAIIVLDQLSYPANLVWNAFGDIMASLTKFGLSRIPSRQWRLFMSNFLATVSGRFSTQDQVLRNFYFVPRDGPVLLFGTSYAECFDLGSLRDEAGPPPEQLNPFRRLSDEDYRALDDKCQKDRNVSISQGFDIHIGSTYAEHRVNEGRIMTFFRPQSGAYFNFLDHDHLHFGGLREGQEGNIRKALKWIETHGKIPITANSKGQLRPVAFNAFVDSVAGGSGVLRANVKKGTWV